MKMAKSFIILILAITTISKGQLQVSAQKNQHQQQFNELFTVTGKPETEASVQVQQQKIEEHKPDGQTYRPITFPDNDESDSNNKWQQPPPPPASPLTLQTIEQANPSGELIRPTRVAVAAVSAHPVSFNDAEVDYIREFAWKLFQGSKLPSPISNLILSPIQPQLQLSLLRQAAAGNTESEIREGIRETNPDITKRLLSRLKNARSETADLGLASAVFTAENLKLNNSFIREAHERHIDILPVNFANADVSSYVVNNWVANATRNQIKSIFRPDVNRGTRLLLANTIYFSGEWKHGFGEVKPEPFYTTEHLVKSVPMMKNLVSLRAGKITLRSGFTGQWVELPYRGDEFSMVVIVPFQRYYLDEFIRSMRSSDFSDILKQLSTSYKKLVHLSMPKFTASSSFSLVNVLLKNGIVDMFTQASQLPFLANGETDLRVDDVLQQGILSVDEKGTIAAAATISHVVTLSLNSAPEEVFFNVDQPFVSVIVDKRNKIPLFVSKIYDP